MLHRHKLLWIGIGTAAAFWIFEALIHTWVFAESTGWTENILPRTANEWWMRPLAGLLIIAFGAYADRTNHALLRIAEERRVVQARLDDALTRVPTDFLPICGHCKAIQEGERWVPSETYLLEHTKTLLSHGLLRVGQSGFLRDHRADCRTGGRPTGE